MLLHCHSSSSWTTACCCCGVGGSFAVVLRRWRRLAGPWLSLALLLHSGVGGAAAASALRGADSLWVPKCNRHRSFARRGLSRCLRCRSHSAMGEEVRDSSGTTGHRGPPSASRRLVGRLGTRGPLKNNSTPEIDEPFVSAWQPKSAARPGPWRRGAPRGRAATRWTGQRGGRATQKD